MTIMRQHVVLALLAAMLLVGCGSGTITNGEATLVPNETSPAFLDRVADEPTVTFNDAARGMVMLLDGDDTFDTFEQRVDYLKSRSVISPDWNLDAFDSINRGQLAHMAYVASEMNGGVWLTVAGPSQRYCLREMQYRGVMGEGTLLASVSGFEYVSTLGRAAMYMATGEVPDAAGDTPEH